MKKLFLLLVLCLLTVIGFAQETKKEAPFCRINGYDCWDIIIHVFEADMWYAKSGYKCANPDLEKKGLYFKKCGRYRGSGDYFILSNDVKITIRPRWQDEIVVDFNANAYLFGYTFQGEKKYPKVVKNDCVVNKQACTDIIDQLNKLWIQHKLEASLSTEKKGLANFVKGMRKVVGARVVPEEYEWTKLVGFSFKKDGLTGVYYPTQGRMYLESPAKMGYESMFSSVLIEKEKKRSYHVFLEAPTN